MTIRTSNGGEAEQVGSLTRVSHFSVEDTPGYIDAPHQPTRVGNESLSIDLGTGQMSSRGFARYTVGQDAPPSSSVMATLRRENGYTTVETEPGNPASRTVIDSAVRQGLVRETSPGYWEDIMAVQAPAAGDSAAPRQPVTDKPEGDQPLAWADQKELAGWNEKLAPLPQAAFDSAMGAAAASITAGDGTLDSAVQRLVTDTGMDPEQARELAEHGEAFYRGNLTRDLLGTGLLTAEEVDPFYEWCRTQHKLAEAMSGLVFAGNTKAFQALARDYAVKKGAA